MASTAGDILFVDTDVLLAATDESLPQHREAGRLLSQSGLHGVHLAASGQNLREYLFVATRPPDTNGPGLQVRDAMAEARGHTFQLMQHRNACLRRTFSPIMAA